VEGRAQAKLDARLLEEVVPHVAREDRITIADYGGGKPVEADNAFKEGADD
jgi:hypothetical protein